MRVTNDALQVPGRIAGSVATSASNGDIPPLKVKLKELMKVLKALMQDTLDIASDPKAGNEMQNPIVLRIEGIVNWIAELEPRRSRPHSNRINAQCKDRWLTCG